MDNDPNHTLPEANNRGDATEILGDSANIVEPSPSQSQELPPIQGYQVYKRLGVGGFGEVYLAFQPHLKRDVAIKVILPKYANNPDFIRRFEVEAELVARLEHPHIVPLFDYWREPNHAYLVFRYLRGGSLRDRLRQGRLSLELIALMLEQIASALALAHRNGVVHRDIKPDNILLDADENSYLTDFGIAKTQDTAEAENAQISGTVAYMAPEQIKGDITPESDIYSLGIMLYEILRGENPYSGLSMFEAISKHLHEPLPDLELAIAPMSPVNAIIKKATAKNLADRYTDARQLAKAFRQAVSGTLTQEVTLKKAASPTLDNTPTIQVTAPTNASRAYQAATEVLDAATEAIFERINPYKGLRPFEEADALDFFGRDTLIQRLKDRFTESHPLYRFLTVVGPSGSGKSSVVKAGLIPAIRRGEISDSDRWFILQMTPGITPITRLENALLSKAVRPESGILDLLQSGGDGLVHAVAQILHNTDAELLLLIDQFEELFTLVESEAERQLFLDLITHAVTAPQSRFRLIVTLRADFYDRPLKYAQFAELIRQRTELVLPLNPTELEDAITQPATRVGLQIDADLVAVIVADIQQEAAALPLLQYALTETFERSNGFRLTLAAYRESGGVFGALARRAEQLYLELLPPQQSMTRQIFLRLVTLGEGSEDTRRRTRYPELTALGDEAENVLNLYGKYRLLTFDREAATRLPTVEVAHEALIREWQRLRAWLDSGRADIRLQRLLAAAAAEWEAAAHDVGFLLTGARLAQYETWADATDILLTQTERTFLQASLAERERVLNAEQERQRRELETQRQLAEQRQRAANRLRYFLVAVLIFLAIAVGLSVFAFDQRETAQDNEATAISQERRANQESLIAQSGRIALQSVFALQNESADLAFLLSVEALEIADIQPVRSSLLTALQDTPQLETFLHGQSSWVTSLVALPNGEIIASSDTGAIVVWRDSQPTTLLPADRITVWKIALDPTNTQLAIAKDNGAIWLVDLNTPTTYTELPPYQVSAFSLVWLDPTTLVIGYGDGTIIVWDTSTQTQLASVKAHTQSVFALAWHPPTALLASGGADQTIILWNMADYANPTPMTTLTDHTNWVLSLTFNPDGTRLASGGADNTLRLWSITANAESGWAISSSGLPIDDHTGWVRQVLYTPDGTRLITGSGDRTIIVRDTNGQRLPSLLPLRAHPNEVHTLALIPYTDHLVSADEDGKVIVWSITPRQPLAQTLNVAPDPTYLTVHPQSAQILTAGEGGLVQRWNGTTLQPMGDSLTASSPIISLVYSPDSTWAAFGLADGHILLHNFTTNITTTLEAHQDAVRSLAISPDGRVLASGSDDHTIILWDMPLATPRQPLSAHTDWVMSLAFSPDSKWLLSGGADTQILLWQMPDGALVQTLPSPHTQGVSALAFNKNGTLFASASRDNGVFLWDFASRTPRGQPLLGHTRAVNTLAFSPDSRVLASGSSDNTVILWDVFTQQAIGLPFAHNDEVLSLDFYPDGNTLVAATFEGILTLWDVNIRDWQHRACQSANRNLSIEEWQTYLPNLPYQPTCFP